MKKDATISWLMAGDPAIAFQAKRDLLDLEDHDLQRTISHEGWGQKLLTLQNPDGHWGSTFYFPKWTNSHYTLLELKHLCFPADHPNIHRTIELILATEKKPDGGVGPGQTIRSDVCVAGMFLNYAAYFQTDENKLESIIDFVMSESMPDGGFNCQSNRSGAHHSSMHSTISVLEGFLSLKHCGYSYRSSDIQRCVKQAEAFLLQHNLFKSDRTGKIIHPSFLTFSYPARWKYNILRALDYFQAANVPWDVRMQDAIDVVLSKRKPDGRWMTAAHHPGQRHFDMEPSRSPSRWNTLMALRVLKKYFDH
jgi:hypothetical protein